MCRNISKSIIILLHLLSFGALPFVKSVSFILRQKNVMLRHLTVQQLLRLCGDHDDKNVDEQLCVVKECYLRHQDGLQFGE